MSKPIEEYTDEELEKAIEMHESLLKINKAEMRSEDPVWNKPFIDTNAKITEKLIELYEERVHRKEKLHHAH